MKRHCHLTFKANGDIGKIAQRLEAEGFTLSMFAVHEGGKAGANRHIHALIETKVEPHNQSRKLSKAIGREYRNRPIKTKAHLWNTMRYIEERFNERKGDVGLEYEGQESVYACFKGDGQRS